MLSFNMIYEVNKNKELRYLDILVELYRQRQSIIKMRKFHA